MSSTHLEKLKGLVAVDVEMEVEVSETGAGAGSGPEPGNGAATVRVASIVAMVVVSLRETMLAVLGDRLGASVMTLHYSTRKMR